MSRGGTIDSETVRARALEQPSSPSKKERQAKRSLAVIVTDGVVKLGGVAPGSKPPKRLSKKAKAHSNEAAVCIPSVSLMDEADDFMDGLCDGLDDVFAAEGADAVPDVLPVIRKTRTFTECKEHFNAVTQLRKEFQKNRAEKPKKPAMKLSRRPSKADLARNSYVQKNEQEMAPVSIEYILHGNIDEARYPFESSDKRLILLAALRVRTSENVIKGPPRSSVSGEDEIAPKDLDYFFQVAGVPSVMEVVTHPSVPLTAGAVFGIPVGNNGQHYALVAQLVPGPDLRMAMAVVATTDGKPIELRNPPFATNLVSCLHMSTTRQDVKKPRFKKKNIGQRSPGYVSFACPGVFVNPGYDDLLVCALRALVTHPCSAIEDRTKRWIRAWAFAHMLDVPITQTDYVELGVCMVMVELFSNPLYTRGQFGDAAERAAALCTSARYEMIKTALTSEAMAVEHAAAMWSAEHPTVKFETALAAVSACCSYEAAQTALEAL